jgi:ComF family protein
VPLTRITRVPVCTDCLAAPEPLAADYFCTACNTPFANRFPLDEHGVCAACRSGLQGFDAAASFGFYEGKLRSLIHLFKYAGMRPLSKPLARCLERAIPAGATFDAVVPVPLHWRKRWRRGFNQAELLAEEVASRHHRPLLNALRRVRGSDSQAGLSKTARRRMVQGAFVARKEINLTGKTVLLIDDVMTTGATASACARALKRSGAKSVSLLTVARADRRWSS